MIPAFGGQALKALTPQTAIRIDRSRCVRHRCYLNSCRRCLDVCPASAITWDTDGLKIVLQLCTQCQCCVAACPTAALQPPELSVLQVLADLAAVPHPVLGCHLQPATSAHARFACLGFLVHPELLLLLTLIFPQGIQLNLSGCSDCPNRHIVGALSGAVAILVELGIDSVVHLVFIPGALEYQPSVLSRREFFGFFRARSMRAGMVMIERLQMETPTQSFGSKQLPLVRAWLLKAMESLPVADQQRIEELLFGSIVFTSTCRACGGCAGVCPTGAIEAADEKGFPPLFERLKCVSCGSCQAFCRQQGVQLVVSSGCNG